MEDMEEDAPENDGPEPIDQEEIFGKPGLKGRYASRVLIAS